ncbi:DUF4238 domain-containing protein [Paenibacillus sp. 1P07SE]|uniref:DUF4238 domain-containing protein n=1 Tax=Paenibacillus sp. 1P07SE TaxID=3132209 RepID=UPI0039A52AEF
MREQKEKRNHHYIPIFHLANFTKKGTKDSTLYAFDTLTGNQHDSKPKSVAFSKKLYSIELPDTPSDLIENTFMDLETKTAPIIRNLCETNQMPVDSDYNYLMNYLALLEVRTPTMRESFSGLMEDMLKSIMHEMVATEERFEATRKGMANEGYKLPISPYMKIKEFVQEDRYSISFNNNNHVHNVLHAMDAIIQPLSSRNWSIVYCPNTLGDFICSDHPVSLHWIKKKERGVFSSPGHGLLGTEVTVPLSSRVMLLGRFEKYMPNKIVLDSRLNLAILNSYSSMNCSRFIFSRKEDFVWYTNEDKIGTLADFRRAILKEK